MPRRRNGCTISSTRDEGEAKDDATAPEPIDKPDIVVPEAGPLVHLAAAGLLHALHEVGAAVVVVDMVAHEITRDLSKQGFSQRRPGR